LPPELLICYLNAGLKLVNVERSFAEKHYADLSAKPFFSGLVDYIISGPVVAMVWEGKSVVTTGRKIIGATNPLASEPGTIRGDFAVDIGRSDLILKFISGFLSLLFISVVDRAWLLVLFL
jgi:nucleoside-diphosphate kinase